MADNEKIKVDQSSVYSLVAEYRKGMQEIEQLKTKLLQDTKAMENEWQGEGSNSILPRIAKLKEDFNNINAQNEKFLSFINDAMSKYTRNENEDIAAVNTHLEDYKNYYEKNDEKEING